MNRLLLTIKRIGINGEGIAYYKRKAVFVPYTIPGEEVEVEIEKDYGTYFSGKAVEIKKMSPERIKPACPYFKECGGCQLQHINYPYQLKLKKEMVEESFDKYFDGNNSKYQIFDTIGMDNPFGYRNKTQLPTRHDGERVVVGMYALNSNFLVYIDKCLLENELITNAMHEILDYLTKKEVNVYNPRSRTGNLRYIVLRGFPGINEIQATFVLCEEEPRIIKILHGIKNIHNIATVAYSINNDPKNVEIISGKVIVIEGKEKINGKLGDLKFEISPNAFFQLNTKQTTVLYDEVKKAINPKGDEKVLDLYCGIGSIGMSLAKSVKEVRGIDININSINDARTFCKLNNIDNCKYYCGNIIKNLEEFEREGFKADVVIIDPPRKGVELQLLNYFQKAKYKKIIYVSCNPSTLVKNLNHLQRDYFVKTVQPVDMFPETANVEAVVCLIKK